MKIAYVTHARVPSAAANNVQSVKMCSSFASSHDVTLYSRPGDGGHVLFERFDVPRSFRAQPLTATGPRGLRTAGWLARLRATVGRAAPDLIYSRDLFSLCALGDLGVPMIYEAHWSPREKPTLRTALLALVAHRSLVRIVSISHTLQNELRSLLPGVSAKIFIVAPSAADGRPAATAVDLPGSGALRVGYAGQLYAGKGAELLIPLAAHMPDVDFHVIGGDPAQVDRWSARAPANLWFHGFRPHAEVASYLAAFDVVLAPYQESVAVSGGAEVSRWMSPLKIFEYMAMARPMVVSDLPVLREVLDSGRTAILVPPREVTAWAAAIDRFRDPEIRGRMGGEARATFLRNFTWEARAVRVLADLPSPCSRRGALARAARSLVPA